MADLRIDVAAEFKGKKAFKEASKATTGLDKAVGKLGKQIATVFAAKQIYNFGKASVKAFAEDQKSAQMLTIAIKNLGLAFEQANVEKFISDLERSSAMADDVLRPAFQALLTTTGSVAKAQQLLQTAIEASRGSGIDLATVAQDLANAYVGNTKGLKKYNLGLTQAELKAMSFTEIMMRLNKQFDGSSAAYLETYAGKMEAITTAVGSAQEVIGESLVNALITLSGAANTTELVTYISNVGQRIADLITSVEKFGFLLKFWFNPKNWLKKGDAGAKEWEELLRKRAYATAKAFDPKNNSLTGFKVDEAARKKAAADAAKRAKELAAAQAKTTAELKKQTALKKAGTVFDLEQIQLVAALKGKLSEDEKLRVEAQLALLNGNEAVATKLTNQILAAQDASGNLAKFLAALPNAKNPFEYLDAYLSYLANKAAAIVTNAPVPSAPSAGSTTVPTVPSTNVPTNPSDGMITYNPLTGLNYNPNANNAPVINVTVQGNVIREQELINQVLAGTQLSSLSGSPSQIGRIAGMFG